MHPDLIDLISLTRVPQVGCVHARILLQHFGSVESIFKSSVQSMEKIEGIGKIRARSIKNFRDFSGSEKEIYFIQRAGIRALALDDPEYPNRLLSACDAPVLLFYKGNTDLNHSRIISIVVTRLYTDYGKDITENLIRDLAPYSVTVVSGPAFGIDAIVHKSAIWYSLSTIGVLAHGLATLYPPGYSLLSKQMIKQGD